jgi:hypothetical protein
MNVKSVKIRAFSVKICVPLIHSCADYDLRMCPYPLFPHCSLFTVHWSLFTGHCSLVTVHCACLPIPVMFQFFFPQAPFFLFLKGLF